MKPNTFNGLIEKGSVEKFEEEGAQILNLGDVAKEMIQTERRMWRK